MTLRVVEIHDRERDVWDEAAVHFSHCHPLNAYGWGKVREIDGWQPSYYLAKEGDMPKGLMMVLVKKIPCTGLSIMYAPKGPLCNVADRDTLQALLAKVREEGRKKRAIFIRIDPNLAEQRFDGESDPFIQAGFIHLEHRWSFWNSPRDVYRLDLAKAATADEIMKTFEPNLRNRIRKAAKEGLSVRRAERLEELRNFYDMFNAFTVEKGFMCRKLEYQQALWHEYIERGNGNLFLAIYGGEIVGGALQLNFDGKCLGMHMGALKEYMKLQPISAVLWDSIKWAKESGFKWYSFRGVGSTPTQEAFKKRFRPEIVSLVGYYDLPFRPVLYRVFYCIEFKVLPMIWRTLMRLRRGYNHVFDKIKIRKLAPAAGSAGPQENLSFRPKPERKSLN